MIQYQTIIDESPVRILPLTITAKGNIQLKDGKIIGFGNDSYILLPYSLEMDFKTLEITFSFLRLVGTEQTILAPSNEKSAFKSVVIKKNGEVFYGDIPLGQSLTNARWYNVYMTFTNNLSVTFKNAEEELICSQVVTQRLESTQFIIGKGDDKWSCYDLRNAYIKYDGRVVWNSGKNMLDINPLMKLYKDGEEILAKDFLKTLRYDLGSIKTDSYLTFDDDGKLKSFPKGLLTIGESLTNHVECYWYNPSSKEFWYCKNGQKSNKLLKPFAEVKSDGFVASEIGEINGSSSW